MLPVSYLQVIYDTGYEHGFRRHCLNEPVDMADDSPSPLYQDSSSVGIVFFGYLVFTIKLGPTLNTTGY